MSAITPPVKRRRLPWIRLFILLIVILAAVSIAYHLLSSPKQRRAAAPPQSVGVAKVATGSMKLTLDALGTVTPIATVTVLPQLSGYLTEVDFTEGQDVAKGQMIAEIDPRPYQIQLQQDQGTLAKDQATLAQARSDLARFLRLQKQNSISEQQVADQQFLVQQDEGTIKIDQANIASAQLNLAYCRITAPVAGRVGLRLIDPGNYVTPSSTTGIAVITTLKPITVIFTIPQNALGHVLARVNTGAKLAVTASSADNATEIASGTLAAIDNQMSTTTGTVQLRANFTNENEALFPNEFVNTRLLVDTLNDVTLVPNTALQTGTPGTYVYLVNADDTVTLRVIKTGTTDGTNTVVTDGLQPGDTVVTDGVDRLTNGAKVAVNSGRPAGAATPSDKSDAKGKTGEKRHRRPAANDQN